MWLLIEVDDISDAGKNEKQRITILDELMEIRYNAVGEVIFSGQGNVFHPMTPIRD